MKFIFNATTQHDAEMIWSTAIDIKLEIYGTGIRQPGPLYICKHTPRACFRQTAEWGENFFTKFDCGRPVLQLEVDWALLSVLMARFDVKL